MGSPPDSLQASGGVEALARARVTEKPVEITTLRSGTGKVFANPDGTRTLRQHARPIHAKRGERWLPVDTTLRRQADGTVTPGVTAVETAFSGGGSMPLLRVSTGDKELTLTWPKPLPTPILDADTATYPEVLPGVDMKVRADVDGFSQVLVVKNAQAARNPELSTVRYGVATKGMSVTMTSAGDLIAKDALKREVLRAPVPKMWDSTGSDSEAPASSGPEAGPRQAPMRTELLNDQLAIAPDPALLTDPTTTFPVYIDPSFTANRLAWTQAYKKYPGSSHWNENDIAKVGYEGRENNVVRPFFRLDTEPVNDKRIIQATFGIHATHSWSCQPRPLQLGLTTPIHPGTSWNNQPAWLETLGEVNVAKGYNSHCPAGGIEFDITDTVRHAADEGWPDLTLGLRANESDKFAWKKFENNPFISIVYNTVPEAPSNLSTVPPTRCGTGENKAVLNTTTPTLSATLNDEDDDNLRGKLEILKNGEVIHSVETDPVTSGSSLAWPDIPKDLLQQGVVYTYRARAFDENDWSSYTTDCEIEIDTRKPDSPTVHSTDFPPEGVGKPVGTPGIVTFTGGANKKITSFIYGFDQDRLGNSVQAGPDGTAMVPITLQHSAPTFLYVKSKDSAGNVSSGPAEYQMMAAKREGPSPHVRGDVNGDAKADISYLVDMGDKRTTSVNHLASAVGFYEPAVFWDTGVNGGYPFDLLKTARGDFDGDGRADMAVFREESSTRNTLTVLKSDGNAYVGRPVVWDSASFGPSPLQQAKVISGDFNGDGRDDLVQFYNGGHDRWAAWTFLSTSTPERMSFAPPSRWLLAAKGSFDVDRIKLVAGDFDGDGKDDIAKFYNDNHNEDLTRQWTYYSTGDSFKRGESQWTDAPGGFNWEYSIFAAGDVNSDGKDDILAMCDHGNAETRVIASTVIDVDQPDWASWWHSGGENTFDATKIKLHIGDYNGDQKTDTATVENINGNRKRLHIFTSTGAGFTDPKKQETGALSTR